MVPDIGGFKDVSVIEVLVKDGQQIDKETPLITLETEKATMDVPAPAAGRIREVKVKTGDKVSEGSLILLLEAAAQPGAAASAAAPAAPAAPAPVAAPPAVAVPLAVPAPAPAAPAAASVATSGRAAIDETAFSGAYASPSVRKFARELGADLGRIKGTGPKQRITQDDVKAHVKKILTAGAAP